MLLLFLSLIYGRENFFRSGGLPRIDFLNRKLFMNQILRGAVI